MSDNLSADYEHMVRWQGVLQNRWVIIYGAMLHFYALKQKTDSEESAINGIINYDRN